MMKSEKLSPVLVNNSAELRHPQTTRLEALSPSSRLSLSNLSIKIRLPLLIGVLLATMIGVSTWAAYRGVKESSLEVGRERLSNVTQQLVDLSQQSNTVLLTQTTTAASEPAVLAFLKGSSTETRAGAIAVLRQFKTPQDQITIQVELWSAARSLVLTFPEGASQQPSDLDLEFKKSSTEPFRSSGAIRIIGDTLGYPMMAAVRDEAGTLMGFLVRWRRVTSTPEARKQLRELLGSEATLYLGNSQGDVWTDLEKVVPKPPVVIGATTGVHHYSRDGNSIMALGKVVNGTPWSIIVEFPDRAFLTHVGGFLRRMILIGFVLLALGLTGAVVLSKTITKPLQSLTGVAAGVSDGNYSSFADIRSKDELGVLGKAFNVMISKIRNSQDDLEREVDDRTAQLNAANKELEAFSYSVSHDLRAPLRHINGFSQALLEDYGDQLDEEGKGFLGELRSASNEMARLIDDMLELARITRTEMSSEIVNLSELASLVAANIQASDKSNGATVNIEEGLVAFGDKRLLVVVLNNLIGNAQKFSSKREQAEITVGQVSINGEDCYFVRDNGAGFEMAYADKMFHAFQRLHSTTEFEGTGIGLATVQRIIHRHGGNVWAEGAVNEGATFYFTLPSMKNVAEDEQVVVDG